MKACVRQLLAQVPELVAAEALFHPERFTRDGHRLERGHGPGVTEEIAPMVLAHYDAEGGLTLTDLNLPGLASFFYTDRKAQH